MGEATPAQSTTGAFAPMLGVGLSSIGAGPMGHGPSRGSAVPQLHSAIVERLRARIELCRRHHSTCEDRYQRGQVESSDREHESTLHLLNVVQQGPGNRKSKGSRASGQQPPEYGGRANGGQRVLEGDQKMSTRMALQGSLRRKMEGHVPKQNSCAFSTSDFKRVRVEAGGMGRAQGNHNLGHAHSLQASSAMAVHRKNYMMPHAVASDVFSMTLKEMKKEPVEVQSCGRSHAEMIFDFKEEGQIDPELQDLFDELTKSVPPLNDLEFEKMLKQDDTFGLDPGRPSSAGAVASMCSPLEKTIKMEHSPDYGQVHGGSSQLRPASAGPSFTMTTSCTASTTTTQKVNTQVGPPRSMPCWPEISHAEQLKQMAANQHQPSLLLHHHHHHTLPAGLASWAPTMSTHSSTSTFPQDKGTRPRLPPQTKGVNNGLFKTNGHHVEMKALAAKPRGHFTPNATSDHGMPLVASSGNKTSNQQDSPPDAQNHQPLHFQNHQTATTLQHGGALPFRLGQQHQGVPPGPRMPANGSVGQLRPPAPTHPLKGPAKSPTMQRHHADKDNTQDQFSRHLTRPPPDYKRSVVGGNVFPGPTSSQSSSAEKDLRCHLQGEMSLSPSDHRFEGHSAPCIGQFSQHNNQNRISPNKPRFLSPNTQGSSFGMNNVAGGQHPRTTADSHSPGVAGQGLGGTMTNMGWCSSGKTGTTGLRRQAQLEPPKHQYLQRPLGPPNHVAPDIRMLPMNPSVRDAGSRLMQPAIGSPSAPNLNQSSPEQRVPVGNFPEAACSSYHSGRPNHVTFDFLPEGDNMVPGINTDSDFIDSLLKSGSGNDDWMKDINLDEILGNHT
uniref:mastermind-like protein 2 n=1 Tax=Doryrhamphus excisus TaxID=161450 RepID=UPI0025ADB018|nr:mastermind-like protein 2 [Doryrhamphus excisus]